MLQKRSDSLDTARRRQRARSKPVWQFNSAGLLYYRRRLYIPLDLAVRTELLQIHHDNALAGYFGEKKTLDLLSRKYYWPSITADVVNYISTYNLCQRIHTP